MPAKRSSPVEPLPLDTTRSSCSRRAPGRSGRTSRSTTAIATPWPRSCACSTGCRSPSSSPRRACACSRRRRSSSACGTASAARRARGAAARQATLRAAIDWSWDLLAPWEQAALAQCSVFEGGFTLEAAEAVLDLDAWPDAPPAMDAVQALVDKSLLRRGCPSRRSRRLRNRRAVLRHVREHPRVRRREAQTRGAAARARGAGAARPLLRGLRHRRGARSAVAAWRRRAVARLRSSSTTWSPRAGAQWREATADRGRDLSRGVGGARAAGAARRSA